eukprot:TRINITY_DN33719_c0_g1_i1.p1 TRINITY_DN33719_c0_g1~~TRINITY_DN33719_c0_g1_i1.p1  ORF type:complete len:326 (+),score=63.08 TRINITY_DN33719_c0_g1_i1:49-1026(+)
MLAYRYAFDGHADVMSVAISPDDSMIASACADGVVRCYSLRGMKETYHVDTMKNFASKLPATCIRFRPQYIGSRTKNVAVISTVMGTIERWHLTSRKCISTITEENEIYCLDYRTDGMLLASAGKDGMIRIYDEEHKGISTTLKWAEATNYREVPSAAHSSRVQSVKWFPGSEHLLISGGWDKTVQLWDTRVDHATGTLYGAYLCGDALDITPDGKQVITASCREDDQLQLWDLTQMSSPIATLPLPQKSEKCQFYTASISPTGSLAAGGATDLVMFESFSSVPYSILSSDAHPIFTSCWSRDGVTLAAAGAKGKISVYQKIDDK